MPKIGRINNFGIKKEAVRNTAETNASVWLPKTELTLQLQNEYFEDTSSIGRRESLLGKEIATQFASGNLSGVIDADTIGYLLFYTLGDVNSIQEGTTGAYHHTFTLNQNSELPTFTAFYNRSDEGQFKANGCNIGTLEMAFAKDESTYSADILAITETTDSGQTPAYTKPTNYLMGKNTKLFYATNTADLDDSTDEIILSNITTNINTNGESDISLGRLNPYDTYHKQFEVEVSFSGKVRNATYNDWFKNNTSLAFLIDTEATNLANIGTSTLKPRLRQYIAPSKVVITYSQPNDDIVTFDAVVNVEIGATAGYAYQAILTNSTASY